jgi:predicted Zn finger-like uncharacterized protein
MHVTCSNCGARYIVDPLAIGPTGRTVQCARCNHRWFERAGPTAGAALSEPPAPSEPATHAAVERAPGQAPYRSGLPAIARPQPRRVRWPFWLAGAVLLAVALGAVLVLHGESGAKSSMPWRATGLSLAPPADVPRATAAARRTGMPAATRVDSAAAIE